MDRRGPKPKNNGQTIHGLFYVLRTGLPGRDTRERHGHNRFNRVREAGIPGRLMDSVVKARDGIVRMIDNSIERLRLCASGVSLWGEAEAASTRSSMRAMSRMADLPAP